MKEQKNKKAKSVLIYAFYGEQKDKLAIETKWYPDIGKIIYGIPRIEIKENKNVVEAVIRWSKDKGIDFVPMKNQDDVNKVCFIDPWTSDECISTVYGTIKQDFKEQMSLSLIDKQEAYDILKNQDVDISTYYLLLMFIAGCTKK